MCSLINLLFESKSSTAEEAHRRGWISGGWATWKDSTGKTVAKTINNKLVPIDKVKDYEEEESIEEFSESIRDNFRPKRFELYIVPNTGDIHLSAIFLHKHQQNQGIGTKIMDELISYADAHNKRITLTPAEKSKEHGTTSSNRLKKFYKRFNFVPNAGRYRDYRVRDSMIRNPTKND